MAEEIRDLEPFLKEALKNGGEWAELFIEERRTSTIRCEDHKVERVESGHEQGAGIRVVLGSNCAYSHTNDLSYKGLMKASQRACQGLKGERGSYTSPSSQSPIISTPQVKLMPFDVSIHIKRDKVIEADETAWKHSQKIKQVTVTYGDSWQRVHIANSLGVHLREERVQSLFLVHVVVSDGRLIQTGYEPIGGAMGFELFELHDVKDVAQRAAQRALLMLEADEAPTGTMSVVISSSAGGTMIHEAVGHGLEADLVQKGLSKFAGKIGSPVASPLVNVVDDATRFPSRGSFFHDDEGTPARRNTLIEEGILRGYLHDLTTSRKDGLPSTGNGRRQSYAHKPIPRMSNTFILPGETDPAEIVSSTSKGLLVKKMGGGQVNTVTGEFIFEVSEGYLIEGGKITRPVRGASLLGDGAKVLMGIDMVGSDLGFSIGTCGKDGQGVPISDGLPTLRIREITIGGTKTA